MNILKSACLPLPMKCASRNVYLDFVCDIPIVGLVLLKRFYAPEACIRITGASTGSSGGLAGMSFPSEESALLDK